MAPSAFAGVTLERGGSVAAQAWGFVCTPQRRLPGAAAGEGQTKPHLLGVAQARDFNAHLSGGAGPWEKSQKPWKAGNEAMGTRNGRSWLPTPGRHVLEQ